MKLFFAAAAVALAKPASAYQIMQDSNGGYCIKVVKYDDNPWPADVTGVITGTPTTGVLTANDAGSTVAQNGLNDPLDDIQPAAQIDWAAYLTACATTCGAALTIHTDGGSSQLTEVEFQAIYDNSPPSTTIDFCQLYPTINPHSCVGDGNYDAWQQSSLEPTIAACCLDSHPWAYYSCVEESSGIVSMGDARWYSDYTSKKCVRNCDAENMFNPASNSGDGLTPYVDPIFSYECGGFLLNNPPDLEYDTYPETSAGLTDCCENFGEQLPSYCEYQSTLGSETPTATPYPGTVQLNIDGASPALNTWYPDSSNSICKKDCAVVGADATCGGIITKVSEGPLFADSSTCCTTSLPWLSNDATNGCEARSNAGEGEPTDLYWASSDGCKQDCDTSTSTNCESAPTSVKLWDTRANCCKNQNSWVNLDYCETRADPGFPTTSGGTDLWYVDYQNGVCRQDCNLASAPCELADSGSLTFYASSEACCKGSLSSVDLEGCTKGSDEGLTISTVATSQWYVAPSSSDQPCAQDCETGSPGCGGIIAKTGATMFPDADACCKSAFAWVNSALCEALSENNAGASTDLWYVDYGDNVCKQDCDTVSAVCLNPAGPPDDISTQMFPSASTCCSTRLGWIKKDTCVTASETGIDPSDSESPGAGGWRLNDSWSSCVLDCPESGNIEVGDPILTVEPFFSNGINPILIGNTEYDTPLVVGDPYPDQCDGVIGDLSATQYGSNIGSCCRAISWVQHETCESISTGVPSEMYFADPSSSTSYTCVVHQRDNTAGSAVTCASDKVTLPIDFLGVTCDPNIKVSTKLYSSLQDCCNKNYPWNADNCVYESRGVDNPGTSQFYIKWSNEQCAQDCVENPGTPCGGNAQVWDQTFPTLQKCCDQLSWVQQKDCLYDGSG